MATFPATRKDFVVLCVAVAADPRWYIFWCRVALQSFDLGLQGFHFLRKLAVLRLWLAGAGWIFECFALAAPFVMG